MTAYMKALQDTGLFTKKEIDKYAKKADMTFQELIAEEIGNRAEYESQQAKVWDETVDKAEKMLLEKYGRWPLCPYCAQPHALAVEPELGADPHWVCEARGEAVAPVGALGPGGAGESA